MIAIRKYRDLWQYVAEHTAVDRYYFLHLEADLASVIRDIPQGTIFLLATFPSGDCQSPNHDDVEEIDTNYAWVLKKTDQTTMTPEKIITDMHELQQILSSVKSLLKSIAMDTDHQTSFSHDLHNLQLNGLHTEPEYNLFGCNGWGMAFSIKSPGFFNS